MERNETRMRPEFALVAAISALPSLRHKISAMQPPKDADAPFAFYIPTSDSEQQALDGPTGLKSFSAELHLVATSLRHLQRISGKVTQAVQDMEGATFQASQEAAKDGLYGAILVERTEIYPCSPDLYESEVGLYRRMLSVNLDYQTEEDK